MVLKNRKRQTWKKLKAIFTPSAVFIFCWFARWQYAAPRLNKTLAFSKLRVGLETVRNKKKET